MDKSNGGVSTRLLAWFPDSFVCGYPKKIEFEMVGTTPEFKGHLYYRTTEGKQMRLPDAAYEYKVVIATKAILVELIEREDDEPKRTLHN